METILSIIVAILFVFIAVLFMWILLLEIIALCIFKEGHNHYSRVCRICGSYQVQIQSNIEGEDNLTWWEEVYPIGNDPQCICHKYSDYR